VPEEDTGYRLLLRENWPPSVDSTEKSRKAELAVTERLPPKLVG
jgi:hypothetical protein